MLVLLLPFCRHDIVIYQEVNQSPQNVTNNGFKKKVCLIVDIVND